MDEEVSVDPMSMEEVEARIRTLGRALNDQTIALAESARHRAHCEHHYKLQRAQAHLRVRADAMSERATVADVEARVTSLVEQEYFDFLVAEAEEKAATEAGRNLRAQLDAMRSINTNVRTVVQG